MSATPAHEPDLDPDRLLEAIEDPKTRRAAEDLYADWERQGFVRQAHIDRLALIRQLTPQQLAEVSAFLQAVGVHGEEPTDEDIESCETLARDADTQPTSFELNTSGTRLLTPPEVVELSRALQLGMRCSRSLPNAAERTAEQTDIIRRGEVAREKLIVCNQGLVRSVAKHYQVHPSFPMDDLVGEGTLGLIKAVERFDSTRGYKFSTYAVWWIRQSILRALANRASTIRIPVHRAQDIFKFRRTAELLKQEGCGIEPTIDELAKALQWSEEKILSIQELSQMTYVSTNASIATNEDLEFGETLATDAISPLDTCDAKERKSFVINALDSLTPQQRDILERRFGLANFGVTETLEAIGEYYHLTRERIRQIQEEALKKMAPAARRWISKGLVD